MKSSTRYEIRFSGSGGQGIITAAVILADAIGSFDGRYVCQTQSYGPEAERRQEQGGSWSSRTVRSIIPRPCGSISCWP